MPQMAPYNWLNLNLFFSLIMMFYITYIFFFPLKNSFLDEWKSKLTLPTPQKFNLKW